MKLGGTCLIEFIALDIVNNKKRFKKLDSFRSIFDRTEQAKRYAISECKERKIKCDEEDIRDIAWKVDDYYHDIVKYGKVLN